MKITPVILSGGNGTRLWPLSTNELPKQFLSLVSNNTMIQDTLLRLDGLELDNPIISCGENHRFLVAQQIGEISSKKPTIILEPMPKNTAPAIAAACCAALENNKDSIVLVLPSDHVIRDIDVFQNCVKIAVQLAKENNLVTFGVVPTFPATGYGYIKSGKHLAHHVYNLDKFVEKPCLEKAEEYLQSGEYSWNSGMFVFKASVYLEELKKYNPEMAKYSIESYEQAKRENDFIRLDSSTFEKIQGTSIDYAVMEKTACGKIVKLNAGWDDVGSWSALYDISTKDSKLNVIHGNVISLDTTSSYIRGGKRTIATIGLDNIVVVDSDDALLISAKGKIQEVKNVVEKLKNKDK